jgi:hypothetical protein
MQTQWDLPESPENLYGVSEERWALWPNAARMLFNRVMESSYDSRAVCPGVAIDSQADWRCIRWNFAWIAAEILTQMLKVPRGGK